jgi:hypothetical protein
MNFKAQLEEHLGHVTERRHRLVQAELSGKVTDTMPNLIMLIALRLPFEGAVTTEVER